jgi:DMSO/TMAO reductase YedYZ molybdopterin-dependent catalytic subunit
LPLHIRHIAAVMGLALVGCLPISASIGAEPDSVIVTGPGAPATLTTDELAKLPAITLNIAFATDHGPRQAVFEGPLLWAVLDHLHAVDPAKPAGYVRQTIVVTGRDGYTATIALGEIAPQFEDKQVILAERMDGKPMDQLRVVVPGDHRGGRSVHDVARITVIPVPPSQP